MTRSSSYRVSRRSFLKGAAMAGAGLALSGCAVPGAIPVANT